MGLVDVYSLSFSQAEDYYWVSAYFVPFPLNPHSDSGAPEGWITMPTKDGRLLYWEDWNKITDRNSAGC